MEMGRNTMKNGKWIGVQEWIARSVEPDLVRANLINDKISEGRNAIVGQRPHFSLNHVSLGGNRPRLQLHRCLCLDVAKL